ncbi:MAG: DUF4442 domain-containing protein [Flavobacteriales bacterium]|nr:DUF4442 domain-containing protein [Flavobacteriales bacterium]MCB9198478.1 DUF4442 domain-containing protein [Flavobacteriales bacterium]
MESVLNPEPIKKLQKNFTNNFKFRTAMFSMLPMGWLSGMKIKTLTDEICEVTVPYKRWNKNPFKSTFWAVLGMAAEMSSGALLVMYTNNQKPSVAMLVVECKGEFFKKATDLTTFTCNDGLKIKAAIEETMSTGEPIQIPCVMEGYNKAGELVAKYQFTWSVKARKK